MLKNFYENHLRQVLFGDTARSIATHNFRHHWIQLADELASSVVIAVARAIDQCANVLIVVHA